MTSPRWTPTLTLLLAIALLVVACKKEQPAAGDEATDTAAATKQDKSPLEEARDNTSAYAALPKDYAKEGQTKAQEDLGRMLYYEARLSKNHDISCNSCHGLDVFGVDNEKTSPGHKKQLGTRNSPTVYNAAGHKTQFWDGRAADVEDQAKGPVLNPVEMTMKDEAAVVAALKSIPGYAEPFKVAFPSAEDPITYDNMAAAVEVMAAHQLGRDLSEDEAGKIVAWLQALTGEIPKDYIKKPELPESGPDTPKPAPS